MTARTEEPRAAAPGPALRHHLAIYDLDRTITRLPTWTPFLLHAARTAAPWRLALVPVAAIAAGLHALKVLPRRSLKQVMHRLMLGTRAEADLARTAGAFADRFVARHIAPGARASIAADQAAGYRVVIATAAHRFYAAPIAAALGIDDLIATEASVDAAGRVTARIAGPNCYGADKHRMIEAWMAGAGIARDDAHVRFYSDHRSDLPALQWADEAVAVNPGAPLRRIARQRGWPVLDWR